MHSQTAADSGVSLCTRHAKATAAAAPAWKWSIPTTSCSTRGLPTLVQVIREQAAHTRRPPCPCGVQHF